MLHTRLNQIRNAKQALLRRQRDQGKTPTRAHVTLEQECRVLATAAKLLRTDQLNTLIATIYGPKADDIR